MIEKTRFYKPSELPKLHPFFGNFQRGNRTALYSLLRNNLKVVEYKTDQGKRRIQIEGRQIIDFLKSKGLTITEE